MFVNSQSGFIYKKKLKRENSKFSFGGIFFSTLIETNLKINKIS